MVRSLVGGTDRGGRESRRPVTWPVDMLRRTERASDVVVAPPHGLNLVEVVYPSEGRLRRPRCADAQSTRTSNNAAGQDEVGFGAAER